MNPNLTPHTNDQTKLLVRVLDDSLTFLGVSRNDILMLNPPPLVPGQLPVWALRGELHARYISVGPTGQTFATLPLLSGEIVQDPIPDADLPEIQIVGWIENAGR